MSERSSCACPLPREFFDATLSDMEESSMKMKNLFLALALGAFGCSAWAQPAGYPNKPVQHNHRLRAGRCGRHRGARDERSSSRRRSANRWWSTTSRARARASPRSIVAKSPPDGYTLLIASPSSISVNPALNPKFGLHAA